MTHNIWNIFYAMLLASVILLGILLNKAYGTIDTRHLESVGNSTSLVASAFQSHLRDIERTLYLIGREVNRLHEENAEKQKIVHYLDRTLQDSKGFVGFGYIAPNGSFLYTTTNLHLENKHINLLKNPKTKASFLRTLQSKTLFLGRTYFFKEIDKWVIPFRLAIRDDNGDVIGVMTTGLQVSHNKSYLVDKKLLPHLEVVVIREADEDGKMFRQYSSFNDVSYERLYNLPLSKRIIQIAKKEFTKRGFSFEKMRIYPKIVTFHAYNIKNEKVVCGMIYDPHTKEWIIVSEKRSLMMNEFYTTVFLYISIFLIALMVFWILFQRLSKQETQKQQELIFQAEHDLLTKLPNRLYLYRHIGEWRKHNPNRFYVLFIDLDNFKHINDKAGHTIGDKLLIKVSERLRAFFHHEEMLIRQGGDEFIVVVPYQKKSIFSTYIEVLISTIMQAYIIEEKEYRLGMSIGISEYPKDSQNFDELLSFADVAMYEAKKIRNTYAFFTQKFRKKALRETNIEQNLRGALHRNELWVEYQPQHNIKDGTLYGVEALVRWKNDKLGFVPPDIFIGVAEQIGMMSEIGNFVLSRALSEIASLQQETGLHFRLSVNVSVVQFKDKNFLENFLELLGHASLQRSSITVEITESLMVEELEDVLPILKALKDEGIEISFDDFGTGYSSLGMLRRLPIDELKIDKSFIDTLLEDEQDKLLVQSIIDIGQNFAMVMLAEGVESQEQYEMLHHLGCDVVQGYYFSKPLPLDGLKQYIQNMV